MDAFLIHAIEHYAQFHNVEGFILKLQSKGIAPELEHAALFRGI